MERRKVLAIAVAFEGGLAALAWGLGAAFGIPAFGDLRFTGPAVLLGVAASLPLLAAVALALRSRWPPLARLRETVHRVVGELFADFSLVDLAIVSALAGIGEEALFRGFLQTALAGRLGTWTAVAVAGVLFGLAHFVSLTYAVYAALVGVYLGALMVLSDNLLVPVLVHALFDFVALAYLVHSVQRETPGQSGPPAQRSERSVPSEDAPAGR